MKLAFSNIAWDTEWESSVLEALSQSGFTGLEIAPTKLFGNDPYSRIEEALEYKSLVKDKYGLEICSLQSMWFGKTGNIFSSDEERKELFDYTLRAIDFASAISCKNLVFGNPKARNRETEGKDSQVKSFFCELSRKAYEKGSCLSLEANPHIYGTNFINTTHEAFEYCESVPFMKVNLDLGTVICNEEDIDEILSKLNLVNHIHISEPYLKKIQTRDLHKKLRDIDFDGFISVEMGQQSKADVLDTIRYVREVFS